MILAGVMIPDQVLMVVGLVIFGLMILGIASGISRRRRAALRAHLGFDGEVVYADAGRHTKSFVSDTYGIVAKPDFILKLDGGVMAVVEYKSRANGRLYASDIAQVKATVIAARETYDVTQAYVIAGETRHEIDVNKTSAALYREIEALAKHARAANAGEIVEVYAAHPSLCKGCAVKGSCKKPF